MLWRYRGTGSGTDATAYQCADNDANRPANQADDYPGSGTGQSTASGAVILGLAAPGQAAEQQKKKGCMAHQWFIPFKKTLPDSGSVLSPVTKRNTSFPFRPAGIRTPPVRRRRG